MDTFILEKLTERIFSSPSNPQSIGKAKYTVKIVKTLYKKVIGDQVAFSEALLTYHDIPEGPNLPVPAQLIIGCHLNSDLPAVWQADKDKTKVEARYQHKRRYLQNPRFDTKYNIQSLI